MNQIQIVRRKRIQTFRNATDYEIDEWMKKQGPEMTILGLSTCVKNIKNFDIQTTTIIYEIWVKENVND